MGRLIDPRITLMNSISKFGFLRVAVVSPELKVAAIEFNAAKICEAVAAAANHDVQLAVFPELCLTSYSCGDLFHSHSIRSRALDQLEKIQQACARGGVASIVGLPLLVEGRLFNAACLIDAQGDLRGFVPKTYLPNTNEFYEARWFTRGDLAAKKEIEIAGRQIPFGVDLLFVAENFPDCVVGIEICEDLWAPNPPSSAMCVAGASLIANPSASTEVLGKKSYRSALVAQQSARCLAAYAYAGAGPGESTTDVVYSGHSMVFENGSLLAETQRFRFETTMAIADIDLQKIAQERLRNSSFAQTHPSREFRRISFQWEPRSAQDLRRRVDRLPFVPQDPELRSAHCEEIFSIQSTGLAKRILHTGVKSIVLGLSGGLDSTLAALVAARAFSSVGLDPKGVVAISMPGFGTTSRTRKNAENLAADLGFTLRTISIADSVASHLRDISHPEGTHDVTFENAQARERTQILMDVANQVGGFVLGTGDLSESALGWCTFNGDHMSMYHVNVGVPKTLVRHLIEWCADEVFNGETSTLLRNIAATPISPELLPADSNGEITQKTEDILGPYEVHDFFLFHTVRNGFGLEKIQFLAEKALGDSYTAGQIEGWLKLFNRRFFSQQFKRSSMPDGPKVGSVALSPRGDWRMPSDAVCQA
jgi:NAD+ synthase (glutamine-hydrolysing)